MSKSAENKNPIYINIYKIIIILINSYNFNIKKGFDLEDWILGLENPNDLDVVQELKSIDIWLGDEPDRPKKWKYNWHTRIQAWLNRTKRFDAPKAKKRHPTFAKLPEIEVPPENDCIASPEAQEEIVAIRQDFLRKCPRLYSMYPDIYSDIPHPKEWDEPNHPAHKFRRSK